MPPGTVSSRVRLIMDAQKVEEAEVEQSGVPVERQASVPRLQVRQCPRPCSCVGGVFVAGCVCRGVAMVAIMTCDYARSVCRRVCLCART